MTNELRDLDLNTDGNFNTALRLSGQLERNYKKALNVDGFLRMNSKPPMKYGKTRMALVDERFSFLRGKRVYGTIRKWHSLPSKDAVSEYTDCVPSAVVITRCPRKTENESHRLSLLLNSDDGDDFAVKAARRIDDYKVIKDLNFPVISFTCLAGLYRKPGNKIVPAAWHAIRKIESGKLNVIDYEQSISIKISANDAKKYRAWLRKGKHGNCPISSPAFGFELCGDRNLYWKRPASTLFLDLETAQCLLFCRNSGFRLPFIVKTLDEAFKAIVPSELIGKVDVTLFNEWFIVPVNPKDVPEKSKSTSFSDKYTGVQLPHDETSCFVFSDDVRISDKVYAFNSRIETDMNSRNIAGWSYFTKSAATKVVVADGVE